MTSASLRDPAGHLCIVDERVLRVVNHAGVGDLNTFLNSSAAKTFLDAELIVSTKVLDAAEIVDVASGKTMKALLADPQASMVVEHQRVAFPSFPYEWPAEMLHAAASLTLDLAEKLGDEGLGLKDASPYNVLYCGARPVFVDLLSFEKRDPRDPTWLPFAQFVRTFLLPLLVNKSFGISIQQLLTTHRDGVEPEEVLSLAGPLQKLSPPFLTLVSIPSWLARGKSSQSETIYQKQLLPDPQKAGFILRRVLQSLRRKLAQVTPAPNQQSAWSNYVEKNNYSQDYVPAKQALIEDVMRESAPRRVLDVGCNTGHFSRIAARNGASVVSIDYDPVVVGQLWRSARTEGLDILPLVVNLARPSAAIGWRNQECPSFLARAGGHFDAVFMLAVIHHMLVSERIPLAEIVDLAAELTTDILVIEFVAPSDPMFRRITRGRDNLFQDLTRESFEETCKSHFEVVRRERLDVTDRWIYVMKKKGTVQTCYEMQQ